MLLVLRIVLVPLLIAAVTLATRRWGHRVGAFVTALPAVAGPTLLFYAIQQGTLFAADAARGSLLGLVGVAAFCLVYARASERCHWSLCLLLGWAAFAMVTMLMYRVHVGPMAAFLIAVASCYFLLRPFTVSLRSKTCSSLNLPYNICLASSWPALCT